MSLVCVIEYKIYIWANMKYWGTKSMVFDLIISVYDIGTKVGLVITRDFSGYWDSHLIRILYRNF